jgi:DNA-binding MarR family transcriptional regulator
VSYNVKKMVQNGYLAQQRSLHDRRSIHVSRTGKGIKLRDRLITMHQRHAAMLSRGALSADDLQGAGATLLEEREVRLEALRAALIEGEQSAPSEPFDFDRFVEEKRQSPPE